MSLLSRAFIRNLYGSPERRTQPVPRVPLPASKRVRRRLAHLSAQFALAPRVSQPVSGLQTLTGKADLLPKGHLFRLRIARLLRNRRADVRFNDARREGADE